MKNQISFEEMILEESKIANNIEKYGGIAKKFNGFVKTFVNLDENSAEKLGRRTGKYVTFDCDCRKKIDTDELSKQIANVIRDFTKNRIKKNGKILIIGLGNSIITADNLGRSTIDNLDLTKRRRAVLQGFCPDVASVTNIESVNIVKGLIKEEKPDLVIIIDSLATSSFNKLCSSYQLTTAGIAAGGGVGATDKLLTAEALGVDVIAVGLPLIINIERAIPKKGDFYCGKKYLCPQEIDIFVKNAGRILAKSIESAFN